jgi:hypothetical protein
MTTAVAPTGLTAAEVAGAALAMVLWRIRRAGRRAQRS